jgi:hypothetical protein
MAAQTSKTIKFGDKLIYDPLKLEQKLPYQLILQHLSGSDLLRLSESSNEWNQLIANSPESTKQLKLFIDENWNHEFDFKVIKNTNRTYENVVIKNLLRSRVEVHKIFCRFDDFLVSIDTSFDFQMNGIQLPRLKSLRLATTCPSAHFQHGLLSAVINLEKLELSGPNQYPEKVVECLQANPDLKILILENEAPEQVFRCLDDAVDFQLNVLKLDKADFSDGTDHNLRKFLSGQINSIVDLKVLNCNFALFCSIFTYMKRLRCLTYSPATSNMFPQSCSFEPHPSLEELNLIQVSLPMLQTFVLYTPKLKKLYLSDPTPSMFKLIMNHAKELVEFRYAFLRGIEATNEELKEQFELMKVRSNLDSKIEIIEQI